MTLYSIIHPLEHNTGKKEWKLGKILPRKLYFSYLKKRIPVSIKDITYLGIEGQEIQLPFSMAELRELEDDYIKGMIEKLVERYEIHYLYMEPNLLKHFRTIDELMVPSYHNLLLYILLPKIFPLVLEKKNINKKDMRLVIIDSGDRKIEYILELLIWELNYLTIITDRPEYFNGFVDIIYDNTGLVIELLTNDNREEIHGEVIIDMSKDYQKCYMYFDKDAVILDLESNIKKRQYLYSRKRELVIFNDVILHSRRQVVDNGLFSLILLSRSRLLRDFTDDKNRDYVKNKLFDLCEEFHIDIEKLITNN